MKQPEKVTTGMQPDSAEEEQMVEKAFQNVLSAYLASNHRKKVEIIERAYRFAKEAHKGSSPPQRRAVYTASHCRGADRDFGVRTGINLDMCGPAP